MEHLWVRPTGLRPGEAENNTRENAGVSLGVPCGRSWTLLCYVGPGRIPLGTEKQPNWPRGLRTGGSRFLLTPFVPVPVLSSVWAAGSLLLFHYTDWPHPSHHVPVRSCERVSISSRSCPGRATHREEGACVIGPKSKDFSWARNQRTSVNI